MKNEQIFDLYKPLRNFLGKVKLIDSLRGIHAHSTFQDFNKKLPFYIYNTPIDYPNAKKLTDFIPFGIMPWEIHTITKELILNGQLYGGKKTMENWSCLASAINKYKSLVKEISEKYINEKNVLRELNRLSHKQFKWEGKANFEIFGRYYYMYKDTELNKIIKSTFKLDINEIYFIGLTLFGGYLNKFAINLPIKNTLKINRDKIELFLSQFAKDYLSLKNEMIKQQEYNEKYEYSFNLLCKYPLIQIEKNTDNLLICPIPRLLFERLSEGIYYEIRGKNGFDSAFGTSFQKTIGKILTSRCKDAKIFSEVKYNKMQNRTVDWILEFSDCSLFIECKTKRLLMNAKMELLNSDYLDLEYDKLASFVVQTYINVHNYENNKFPNYKYKPELKIHLIIVTSEDWFCFGSELFNLLNKKIKEKFDQKKLPLSMVEKYPYHICSVNDLDTLLITGNQIKISTILNDKFKLQETRTHNLTSYILNRYKDTYEKEYKPMFQQEIKSMIDKKLFSIKNN